MSEQDKPQDGELPIITFTRKWDTRKHVYGYQIKIYHTDHVEIPIISTGGGRTGIGLVLVLEDGKFLKEKDLTLLITEAAGYIFEVVAPTGTEAEPERTAEFKQLLADSGGAANLFNSHGMENEDLRIKPVTRGEALIFLDKMEEDLNDLLEQMDEEEDPEEERP